MKNVILVLSIILGCLTFSNAQSSLNDYKYVIVPKKYDFLKLYDQYQLNSLTKFLFNKNGFTSLIENENYPEDLVNNRCLSLKVDVEKLNSLLKTKLVILLDTPELFSTACSVNGNVADEEEVENAVSNGALIALPCSHGFTFATNLNIKGRVTKA